LKYVLNKYVDDHYITLLIAPEGIEIQVLKKLLMITCHLLIAPEGIEMEYKPAYIKPTTPQLLIAPEGIEMVIRVQWSGLLPPNS